MFVRRFIIVYFKEKHLIGHAKNPFSTNPFLQLIPPINPQLLPVI